MILRRNRVNGGMKVYDMDWKRKTGGWKVKSWKQKVKELVMEYRLQDEVEKLERGEWDEQKWKEIVDEAVERVGKEQWESDVRMGGKLGLCEIKQIWGFEPYLEGKFGKGEVLLARFRSRAPAVGDELKRWESKVGEVWKGGVCKVCKEGVVETIKHVLLECEAYRVERDEWEKSVKCVVSSVPGWAQADPMKLMLGWSQPNDSFRERAIMLRASSRFLAALWGARATMIHGPRDTSRGVKDPWGYGTK